MQRSERQSEALDLSGNASVVFTDNGSEAWTGIPGQTERPAWDDTTLTATDTDTYVGVWPNPATQEAIRQSDAQKDLTSFDDVDAFKQHLRDL